MKPCTVNDNAQSDETPRPDIHARITAQIVAALSDGVRPWVRPWNAAHAAERIMRPLRHNGQPYTGINVLSLWVSASVQGFAAPIWMTYRQAVELGAHVRKGENGSPVVYANSITRHETDTDSASKSRATFTSSRGKRFSTSNKSTDCPPSTRRRRHRASTCPPASPVRSASSAPPVPRSSTVATGLSPTLD